MTPHTLPASSCSVSCLCLLLLLLPPLFIYSLSLLLSFHSTPLFSFSLLYLSLSLCVFLFLTLTLSFSLFWLVCWLKSLVSPQPSLSYHSLGLISNFQIFPWNSRLIDPWLRPLSPLLISSSSPKTHTIFPHDFALWTTLLHQQQHNKETNSPTMHSPPQQPHRNGETTSYPIPNHPFHSTVSLRKLRRFNYLILVFRIASFSFSLASFIFMLSTSRGPNSPRWYHFDAFRYNYFQFIHIWSSLISPSVFCLFLNLSLCLAAEKFTAIPKEKKTKTEKGEFFLYKWMAPFSSIFKTCPSKSKANTSSKKDSIFLSQHNDETE